MSDQHPTPESILHRRRFLQSIAGASGLLLLGGPSAMAEGSLGRSLLLLGGDDQDPGDSEVCTKSESFSSTRTSIVRSGTYTEGGWIGEPKSGTKTDSYSRPATDVWTQAWTTSYVHGDITISPIYNSQSWSWSRNSSYSVVRTISYDGNYWTYVYSHANQAEISQSLTVSTIRTATIPCDEEPLDDSGGMVKRETECELVLSSVDAKHDIFDVESRHSDGVSLNL